MYNGAALLPPPQSGYYQQHHAQHAPPLFVVAPPYPTTASPPLQEQQAPEEALSGFDEFPSPLHASDLVLLEKEIFRLTKAQKSLTQALFFYKKHGDKARGDVAVAEKKLQEFDQADHSNPTTTTSSTSAGQVTVDSDTTTATSAKRPREDTDEPSAQAGGEAPAPEASNSASVPSVVPPPPISDSGRPRRRFTQSAALLAGMQKMIAANQKREVASGIGGDAVRQDRERMAKEAKRNTLVDLLNIAKGNAAKAAKAVRELQEKMDPVRGRLATLSSILDTAEVQEADYTGSFFLQCCDSHNDDVSCEKNVDDDAEKTNKDILGVLKSVVYVQPARHNDTTREVIRQQLYAILDSYLAFRAIIDPILSGIKDARDAFLEKRRRQLAEAQELEEQNGAKNWGHRSSLSSSAAPHYSRSSSNSASSSSSLPFIPMSPEEASCILRDSNSSATASAGRQIGGPTFGAGGHQSLQQTTVLPTHEDAAAAPVAEKQTELEWSVYESAMAALDDFE